MMVDVQAIMSTKEQSMKDPEREGETLDTPRWDVECVGIVGPNWHGWTLVAEIVWHNNVRTTKEEMNVGEKAVGILAYREYQKKSGPRAAKPERVNITRVS